MQVSVESPSALERRLTVAVPPDQIEGEVEKRLKALSGRVKVAGFRPGKVPMKVVKQRFGQDVYQEVLGETVQRSLHEALVQEKLRPAGMPQIESTDEKPGEGLQYVAVFEVYPEFEPAPVADIKIERPQVEIGDADVERMLDNLRRQRLGWEPVERPAQTGDRVTLDFEGTLDGEPFEGNRGEGAAVVLGEGRLIESLESQLVGLSPAEERTLDVLFPEDYHAEHLAGKTVQFAVQIKAVAEPKLPEIDEEFAAGFGVTEGGVEALKVEVKANMERELRQTVRNRVKDQVMTALREANEVELPKALITQEVARLRQQAQASMGGQDMSALGDEIFAPEAERRVALGLIIAEIVKRNEIKPDPGRMDEALRELAASYEDPEQVVQYYRHNQEAMASLEAMVVEEKVVEWVLDQASVEESPMSFEDLMNPKGGEQSA
jgi:trigger factor